MIYQLISIFSINLLAVLRIALIQMSVGSNKFENVKKACKLVKEAASKGAELVALPVIILKLF